MLFVLQILVCEIEEGSFTVSNVNETVEVVDDAAADFISCRCVSCKDIFGLGCELEALRQNPQTRSDIFNDD